MLEQHADPSAAHFTFKQRNFDPETRQARKAEGPGAVEDTVEKEVEGLAEEIVREDEERRAEELVSVTVPRRVGCADWMAGRAGEGVEKPRVECLGRSGRRTISGSRRNHSRLSLTDRRS